jgi:peptidoglycan/LPS O-acetylase OafA/YrhL
MYKGPEFIDRTMSVYLDLLRFSAALLVLMEHLDRDGFSTAWLHMNRLGHTAVIVFFVLSGLVIHHSTTKSQRGARDYLLARASRILSVALPALAIAFLMRLWLDSFDGKFLVVLPEDENASWPKFFASLFFYSEAWGMRLYPPLNLPFWSLCYEVWYYVMFGLLLFAPKHSLRMWMLLVFLLIGPQIFVLFPIWLMGVWLNRSGTRWQLGPTLASLIWLGSLVAVLIIGQSEIDKQLSEWLRLNVRGYWRLGHSNRFITDYLLGVLVCLHLIAFRALYLSNWGSSLVSAFDKVRGPAAYLAGFSFSLYLFHRPITISAGLLLKRIDSEPLQSVLVGLATVLCCAFLSHLTEARRTKMRTMLEPLLQKWWPKLR